MPLHRFLGNKLADGTDGGTPKLEGVGCFVIYCRKCHYGLCRDIELGTSVKGGKIHNVIFVDPCPNCETGEVIPYPPQYLEALRDPR